MHMFPPTTVPYMVRLVTSKIRCRQKKAGGQEYTGQRPVTDSFGDDGDMSPRPAPPRARRGIILLNHVQSTDLVPQSQNCTANKSSSKDDTV